MNFPKFRRRLPLFALGIGIAVMLLRLGIYTLTTDKKGLLISGHPLQWLLWVTIAAAAVLIILAVFPLTGNHSYVSLFPASIAGTAGCVVLAAGIGLSVFRHGFESGAVEMVYTITGILATAALILMGLCRIAGKAPFFALPALVCLHFTAYAVNIYPQWSSHPQLLDSFFTLMSCVGLMMTFYQHCAFCVNMGSHRTCLGVGLLTIPFSMAAVIENPDSSLFLCASFWALTNLCSATPVYKGHYLR